jgi:hypothetical protein
MEEIVSAFIIAKRIRLRPYIENYYIFGTAVIV